LSTPLLLLILLAGGPLAHAYYDPGIQRWINRDPIQEHGGFNVHRFVANNPMSWRDSFGLEVGPRFTKPVPPGINSVVCRNGKPEVQLSGNAKGRADVACTRKHEQLHIKQYQARYGENFCDGVPDGRVPADASTDYADWITRIECEAHRAGYECRRRKYFCGVLTPEQKFDYRIGMEGDRFRYRQLGCEKLGFPALPDDKL
jgi:hypothetical protein